MNKGNGVEIKKWWLVVIHRDFKFDGDPQLWPSNEVPEKLAEYEGDKVNIAVYAKNAPEATRAATGIYWTNPWGKDIYY